MHILYSQLVTDAHLSPEQQILLQGLRAGSTPTITADAPVAAGGGAREHKSFEAAQDWVTAFFDKGAEEVLGYYADDFVWEDIEFMQTITTKEELYKAFVVFNNSGPESPFGVHKFEVLTYDGGPAGKSRGVRRTEGTPPEWQGGLEGDYARFANNIYLGTNFDYDEWGYMQWVWKATHNSDFFGIPAAGKTTVTRGTTTQMYRNGKIVPLPHPLEFPRVRDATGPHPAAGRGVAQQSRPRQLIGRAMRYSLLGRSGLRVSKLALGTMTFGTGAEWSRPEEDCRPVFDAYVEAGGNFIDTANMYTGGESEKMIGRFIASDRDRFVVASKYANAVPGAGDPNAAGVHRKSLTRSLDASLKRLGTDYIDLYFVHWWDFTTPVEEVQRALTDAIAAGKILHIGLSDVPAWVVSRGADLP